MDFNKINLDNLISSDEVDFDEGMRKKLIKRDMIKRQAAYQTLSKPKQQMLETIEKEIDEYIK